MKSNIFFKLATLFICSFLVCGFTSLQAQMEQGTINERRLIKTVLMKFPSNLFPIPITVEEVGGYYQSGDVLKGKVSENGFWEILDGRINYWDEGIIPFLIEPGHPMKNEILEAIAYINKETDLELMPFSSSSHITCLYFVNFPGCASFVGKIEDPNHFEDGFKQIIRIGEVCSFGNIVHEICHAAGMIHEQQRDDRDNFVEIIRENIEDGFRHNFNLWPGFTPNMRVPYNQASIMHYPPYAFSKDGISNTIKIKYLSSCDPFPIGQRFQLSSCDIEVLNWIASQ